MLAAYEVNRNAVDRNSINVANRVGTDCMEAIDRPANQTIYRNENIMSRFSFLIIKRTNSRL